MGLDARLRVIVLPVKPEIEELGDEFLGAATNVEALHDLGIVSSELVWRGQHQEVDSNGQKVLLNSAGLPEFTGI
jgi:hypothetical protein